MRLSIHHTTTYRFGAPHSHGLQRLRLTPGEGCGQRILSWAMALTGAEIEAEYEDHNANRTTLVSLHPGASELSIACSGVVETSDQSGVLGFHAGRLPLWAFLAPTSLTRPGPRLKALVASLAAKHGDMVGLLHELSGAVLGAMAWEVGATDVQTTAEAALAAGKGVCQDHAQAFIAAARMLGVPARYVSGYLLMEGRVEQEAGHAWAEAHVEGLGWVGFDVANGISPDARYVRLASGRDYAEAAPVTGISYGSGAGILSVSLAVEQQSVQQ